MRASVFVFDPGEVEMTMPKTPWFVETRPQFLILSVLLAAHGGALAFWAGPGPFDWVRFVLAMVGLVSLHASVNVLNDWHDFSRSGIDRSTVQTPFSGGSGLLPKGAMTSKQTLTLGIGTLVVGCGIGVYLASVSGWVVIGVIGVVGALSVVLYTPLLTKVGLGELFAGLSLGALPVVGVYYLLHGSIDPAAWVSSIPAGLLTYNLLLLNEFPDAAADAAGGRHHMVVLMGKRTARWLYVAMEAGAFVAIAVGVAAGILPLWGLLGLGAAFFALKAIGGAIRDYDSFEGLIPAQGANVMAVLGMNAFLAIGYLVAGLTRG
jgi:1,4-dihydroxy-2-naphthoate polyprenyltransferase